MSWTIRVGWRLALWMLFLIILTGLGLYSWYLILTVPGMENINQFVPWGILPAIYIFFVVSTSGLCIVLSLGEIFGVKGFQPIVRRGLWLALITILVGLLVIVMDLGRPERFYYSLMGHANLASPMLWMIYLYVAYTVFLAVKVWFVFRRDLVLIADSSRGIKRLFYRIVSLGTRDTSSQAARRDAKIAAGIGFVTLVSALVAASNLGNVFAVLDSRPLWHGPFMPIYFILSAMLSGAAITTFATIIVYWARKKPMSSRMRESLFELRKFLTLLIVIDLFFTSWEYSTKAWSLSPYVYKAVEVILIGPLSFQFWSFEIILGLIVPFILLILPRTGKTAVGMLTASFLIIVGVFTLRYDMVIGGLLPPVLAGTFWGAYAPSMAETLFTVGVFALVTLAGIIGELLLPLDEPLQ